MKRRMLQQKHDLNNKNFREKGKADLFCLCLCCPAWSPPAVPALAADDPLTVVNNLSDYIFSLIHAIGLILLGFGILRPVSQELHDPPSAPTVC